MTEYQVKSSLKGLIALLAIVGFYQSAELVSACPETESDTELDGDQSMGDPAFMRKDPVVNVTLFHQKALLDLHLSRVGKPSALIEAEQKRYAEFLSSIQSNPATVFFEAMKLWESGGSRELQSQALRVSLPLVASTEESELLQVMMRALNDLEKEKTECIRLGRGNSLEKSIAMKRLALLERNPSLRNK